MASLRAMFLVAALSLAACGAEPLQPGTDAERYLPAGDVTSCHSTRSPTGCGQQIACSGTLAACISRGCWIAGTVTYIYPDGSWRAPDPEPGVWSIDPADVAENGTDVDFACPTGGGAQ
jgi:hypothetical protein